MLAISPLRFQKFSTAPGDFIRVIAKDIKHHVDDSLGDFIIS